MSASNSHFPKNQVSFSAPSRTRALPKTRSNLKANSQEPIAKSQRPSMLDSNRALHPAETLAAICVCGERDLHAGQWHELRRGSLDDLAAHSLRNGLGHVCRS